MYPQILVTGAPGNVGSAVVHELQQANLPFRVGAFDPASARNHLQTHALMEIVPFDFLKPETHQSAFHGIKRLFLVRPPALSNVPRDIAPAIQTAVACGVEHIVFLSLQGVEKNRFVPHYKIEQCILRSGAQYTFLRASFFMQNLSTTHSAEIRERSEISVPVGKAKTSFIDVRDIAAVAARALTQDGHQGKKYTLTGYEALDYDQVASKLTGVLGRPIRYVNPFVLRFIGQHLADGDKLGYTLVLAALYTITRMGNAKTVTHDFETVMNRLPIAFDQFARDYSTCWQA